MNQKLKKVMILSGTYIVLMTVLLIGVSTAKYTESMVAYSSFGTANYNVVLLGVNEATGGTQQFGKTLLAGDLIPGMTYTGVSETNTAKVLPFQVANGTGTEISEISQDYTVTLRTTRNLPLKYSLLLGSTIYEASSPVPLDADGNPVTSGTAAQPDEDGIGWYEWTFKDIANTDSGTVAVASAPVFSLSAGQTASNSHSLVVEWPVTASVNDIAGNSDEYMKEIELLEVRIRSSQRNNTTEEPEDIEFPTDREYSKGYIRLDPEKTVQTYEVDYRAFRRSDSSISSSENAWQYDFVVDNGVTGGTEQPQSETGYKVYIMAPMLWQEGAADDTTGSINYIYRLWTEDRTEEEPYGTGDWTEGTYTTQNTAPYAVWKYDVTDGVLDSTRREDRTEQFKSDPDEEDAIAACSGADSRYLYYKEVHYLDSSGAETVHVLENTEQDGDKTVSASRQDSFHIEISNAGSSFPAYLQQNARLQIIIEKVTDEP